jgi:NADH:ubiquinone oxidoreductase subunit H
LQYYRLLIIWIYVFDWLYFLSCILLVYFYIINIIWAVNWLFSYYSMIFKLNLLMSCAQRRLGPLNLGYYGLLSSVINGFNLIISQFIVPKVNIHLSFQSFPLFYFLLSLIDYILLYPFMLIDLQFTVIIISVVIGISLLFIIFTSISALSKYTILGSIRIISQFISFELIFSTIILIVIWSWNDLSIAIMFYCMNCRLHSNFGVASAGVYSLLSSNCFTFIFFLSVLGESNRLPFDLPEAESELVAGFITEYSSIWFSLILLTEYALIIVCYSWLISLFSIIPKSLILLILIACLLRATLNRLKYDELMSSCWTIILPILFTIIVIMLCCLIYNFYISVVK